MKTKRVGEARIDSVIESSGLYRDPLEMYPDATPEMVERHRSWMVPVCMDASTGVLILAFQSYLIQTPRLTILVDSCVGNDKERPNRPNWHRQKWPRMDNLRATDVQPEEIDTVMCTHMHADHVGWNKVLEDGRWVPTFPNARYLFAKTEYEFWQGTPPGREWMQDIFNDSVLPIMEAVQAELVAGDHEIEDGLWLEPSPGHTPGHVCLNLDSGGQHAVFCGDLMHHAIQVPEPQLSSMFCADPELSRTTRTAFVERHADTGTLLLPTHFPGESAGRIVAAGEQCLFDFDAGS